MATSNNPLAPDPVTTIDEPQPLPGPPQLPEHEQALPHPVIDPTPDPPGEDLSTGVPLGESDDPRFVVHDEDPRLDPNVPNNA